MRGLTQLPKQLPERPHPHSEQLESLHSHSIGLRRVRCLEHGGSEHSQGKPVQTQGQPLAEQLHRVGEKIKAMEEGRVVG